MPKWILLSIPIIALLFYSKKGQAIIRPRKDTEQTQEAEIMIWQTPHNGRIYDVYFRDAEREYNLPIGLLSRVAYQESRYKADAQSPAGAIGLMQIVPRWHPDVDPTDPVASIYYGAKYLKENYGRFHSWDRALAAYNWGPGNVRTALAEFGNDWLLSAPTETKNYVADISKDVGLA